MRILTVHNYYQQPGGEDKVFQDEAKLLFENGHHVETLRFDNSDIKTPADRFLAVLGLVYNIRSAARLKRKIREFKPDIIHVHNFTAVASPSVFFAAERAGVPVVVTLHNYRLICPTATLFLSGSIYEKSVNCIIPWHAISKGAYRNSKLETAAIALSMAFHNIIGTWKFKVNRFIVLTEFCRQKFIDSVVRISPDQFCVKPNFVFDNGAGDTKRDSSFLYVGRLCEEKGLNVLLKAASRHHFELVIIGDGPLRDKVLQYARDYSNIAYKGFLGHASVINEMKCCSALIFPSIWYEGFPVSIAECFSTATPVIASNLGSTGEIVEDGVNGLHFKAGDENDLIYKVMQLEGNPELARKLGSNARITYLKKYTPEKNYEAIMDIYNSALGKTDTENEDLSNTVETLSSADIISDKQSLPKITIGIPTYNGAKTILQALHSVFAQAYPNVEIIISDNGSTDSTGDICKELLNTHPEISYHKQSANIGLVPNFNFCLSRATGKYFMWVADDDRLEPGILMKYVEFLEQNRDYALVSGAIHYWRADKLDYVETGFNLTGSWAMMRTLKVYNKSIYGGMFHGMMRTCLGQKVTPMNVFGNDFHFVAGLAFLGKIKNFTIAGYHKQLGGVSKDVRQCARSMGEGKLASRFPHLKVCFDAFSSIMVNNTVYKRVSLPMRLPFALAAFSGAFLCYYGKIFPLSIAGKCKRVIFPLLGIKDRGSFFKRKSLSHRLGN